MCLLGINHLNDGLPVRPDRAAAIERALDHLRAWGFSSLGWQQARDEGRAKKKAENV